MNDTAENENRDSPGAMGAQARLRPHCALSYCTHPRQPPKVLPQQQSLRTLGTCVTSHPRKNVEDNFFFSFLEILACGDPTSLCCWSSRHEKGLCLLPGEIWKAAAIQKAGGDDSPCTGLDPRCLGRLRGRVALTMPSEQLERGLEASDSPL